MFFILYIYLRQFGSFASLFFFIFTVGCGKTVSLSIDFSRWYVNKTSEITEFECVAGANQYGLMYVPYILHSRILLGGTCVEDKCAVIAAIQSKVIPRFYA